MPLPTPTLHTARPLLRPFTKADTDAIFVLHTSPRVLRYWDAPPWRERARAERFIALCRQEGTGARLAIERAADGVFLGWCCLVKWNPDCRSATMGYRLDDAAWGQGFAAESAGALLQWAFDTLDLNRVQAETDTPTQHRATCWRSSGLSAKARYERIASWMARYLIPGCMPSQAGMGTVALTFGGG
jgi:[ribosomal protein S5]-alanine N-acetyltransferase